MFVPRTLRGRLLLIVAVVVAAVIGATEYLESHVFERAAAAELVRTAESTALALADDLEVRRTPLDAASLADRLREFSEAVHAVRAISIVTLVDERPSVLASTASDAGPTVLDTARRAIEARGTVWAEDGQVRTVATTFRSAREPVAGAVVVSVSVAVAGQIQRQAWTIALWLVPGAILILTFFVDLLGDRFVHRPLAGIRQAMQGAARGDLAVRAPVARDDELGAVARGLNDMLARLQNFNAELQARVDEATRELQQRNEELVETYQRVLTLREALARAEQLAAVGQMAASVAHQVGTPLNLASGYVQMIREEEVGNERLNRRLTVVGDQIDRVTAELRTILHRARRPVARQAVAPGDLIDRVADVVRPRLDRQKVGLESSVSRECPHVETDVVQLELALLNVVTNSLDAMPGGGVLALSASPSASGVRLEIRDTGPGIPADLLPRIFDPWVTTKPADRGTGLGLSIAREVIQSHGGTIMVQSEPGAGTAVVIELPAAREQPAASAR